MMYGNYPGMMEGYGWGYGGMIMGLLLIILIVAAGFFIIKYASRDNFNKIGESPMDILKKRYAKGEISKEEFERMKKDIV